MSGRMEKSLLQIKPLQNLLL